VPSYHHLLIINDGETQENSLHLTKRARAERLIDLIRNDELGCEISSELDEVMRESDEEAAAADYPEGVTPRPPRPEDYVDAIGDLLQSNDFDLHLDELEAPIAP